MLDSCLKSNWPITYKNEVRHKSRLDCCKDMGSVIKLSGLSCDYWESMLGSEVAVATGVMSLRPI